MRVKYLSGNLAGTVVDLPPSEAESEVAFGMAEPITVEAELPPPAAVARPVHVGGGWYDLPDGRRIRGRAAALKAMG